MSANPHLSTRTLVVTGPDGSGKSTALSAALRELQAARGVDRVVLATVWDSLPASGVFSSKEAVGAFLASLDGVARTLFIFHAMKQSLSLALAKRPELVLVDGYFYKYAASEMAYGVPEEVVRGAALGFSKPDRVIRFDLDPEAAWRRKSAASHYEKGGKSTGDAEKDRQKFLRFQSQMNAFWDQLEGWYGPWQKVSADQSPEVLAKLVIEEAFALHGS